MKFFTKNSRAFSLSLAFIALAGVAACGDSRTDRALSGGGIGAGVGALGSAVTGGNPATGAVIGGAVGAATGGLTNSRDINLGRPVWRR
ncbi:MAG: YMGG-like glycine zipper-containing protein [Rickettsiales bacterium]